jgi:uncharacterized RmlC-like cupin family protein
MQKTSRAFVLIASLLGATQATSAASIDQMRLSPDDIAAKATEGAGAGTSGVAGIRTTVLLGDPAKPGLYTIRLMIPANTKIRAHTHRDDRAATVVSGTWYFGYGMRASAAAAKPLPAGSFYTEPGAVAHFALTKDEPVVVFITGVGPTDTVYVEPADDPRAKSK